jgi:glyceraldehyde-3-phosphate dehydrogenase/erythrose-4-phosphate dehydrogenase
VKAGERVGVLINPHNRLRKMSNNAAAATAAAAAIYAAAAATFAAAAAAGLQEASETYLAGILGFETRPLVSVDYVNDSRSSIVDAACTQVTATIISVSRCQ